MGKRGRRKHAARRPRHQPTLVQLTIRHVVGRPERASNNQFKNRRCVPRRHPVDRNQRHNGNDNLSDSRRQTSAPSSTNPLAPPEWLSRWTYSALQEIYTQGQETQYQLRGILGSIQELHQGFCPNAMDWTPDTTAGPVNSSTSPASPAACLSPPLQQPASPAQSDSYHPTTPTPPSSSEGEAQETAFNPFQSFTVGAYTPTEANYDSTQAELSTIDPMQEPSRPDVSMTDSTFRDRLVELAPSRYPPAPTVEDEV